MNDITGRNSSVYDALDCPDTAEMRAKAEYVMKIGMLLETGHLSQDEVAHKLGLSQEELSEMLRGQFRDLTVAKISEYLNRLNDKSR
ncbi:XRE family transcriptional regulator [Pseudomonas sp. TH31]|uniref:XRE family transcriptional regulator n=1 Tax=Pseudomonas sp. TH31 TaxID=2796396 RepID=UPI0019145521|nr:XRE family transcriptional regulator [Pseudomonas sp. TH31]MBK5415853.1 XRE family transcriptional regulator [Pseudomonas sp. TH31]